MFWAMQELAGPGDHAIVTVPNYQSMESVPLATGAAVSGLPLDPDAGWALDLDALAALIRPETRLVAVNFPNNPTGALPDPATWTALAALCEERGIVLFSDEVYRGLEPAGTAPLPQAADLSAGRRLDGRDVEGLRAARAADRLAREPRPRAARAAGDAQALHEHLQRGAERADRHRRAAARAGDQGAQPRDHRRQPAALRRVLRPLGGPLRVGAPAGRLRLLPALPRRRRRRGVLPRPRRAGGRGAPARLALRLGARATCRPTASASASGAATPSRRWTRSTPGCARATRGRLRPWCPRIATYSPTSSACDARWTSCSATCSAPAAAAGTPAGRSRPPSTSTTPAIRRAPWCAPSSRASARPSWSWRSAAAS